MTNEADAAAMVQTVKENANRLGLTWQITMASVESGTDATNVSATFDGDDAPTLGLISMIGVLARNERVYVMTVPPAGNYVVGTVSTNKLIAHGQRSGAKAGITVDSGLVGVEWQGRKDHMYYVTTGVMTLASTVNEVMQVGGTLRITADGSTLAGAGVGTQMGAMLIPTIAGTGGGSGAMDGQFVPGSDVQLSAASSARRIVGAGTLSVSNGYGSGPELFVYDLGLALPNIGRTL